MKGDVDLATILAWAMAGELDKRCRLCGELLSVPTGPSTSRCDTCYGAGRFSIAKLLKRQHDTDFQNMEGVWRLALQLPLTPGGQRG